MPWFSSKMTQYGRKSIINRLKHDLIWLNISLKSDGGHAQTTALCCTMYVVQISNLVEIFVTISKLPFCLYRKEDYQLKSVAVTPSAFHELFLMTKIKPHLVSKIHTIYKTLHTVQKIYKYPIQILAKKGLKSI